MGKHIVSYYKLLSPTLIPFITAEFNQIWLFIERKMKMPIPSYIKSILKLCGYENCHTISTIEENDLELIEKEVLKGKFPEGFDFSDFPIGSSGNFRFIRGHQKLILEISKLVKEKLDEGGVDGFTLMKSRKRAIKDDSGKPIKLSKLSSAACSSLDCISEISHSVHSVREHKSNVLRKMILCLITNTPEKFANVCILMAYYRVIESGRHCDLSEEF